MRMMGRKGSMGMKNGEWRIQNDGRFSFFPFFILDSPFFIPPLRRHHLIPPAPLDPPHPPPELPHPPRPPLAGEEQQRSAQEEADPFPNPREPAQVGHPSRA